MEVNEPSAKSSVALTQQAASTRSQYSQSDQCLLCPQTLPSKTSRGRRELMNKLEKESQHCEPKIMAIIEREEVDTIDMV